MLQGLQQKSGPSHKFGFNMFFNQHNRFLKNSISIRARFHPQWTYRSSILPFLAAIKRSRDGFKMFFTKS